MGPWRAAPSPMGPWRPGPPMARACSGRAPGPDLHHLAGPRGWHEPGPLRERHVVRVQDRVPRCSGRPAGDPHLLPRRDHDPRLRGWARGHGPRRRQLLACLAQRRDRGLRPPVQLHPGGDCLGVDPHLQRRRLAAGRARNGITVSIAADGSASAVDASGNARVVQYTTFSQEVRVFDATDSFVQYYVSGDLSA